MKFASKTMQCNFPWRIAKKCHIRNHHKSKLSTLPPTQWWQDSNNIFIHRMPSPPTKVGSRCLHTWSHMSTNLSVGIKCILFIHHHSNHNTHMHTEERKHEYPEKTTCQPCKYKPTTPDFLVMVTVALDTVPQMLLIAYYQVIVSL